MEIYRWLIDHADILGLSTDFIALMVTIFLTVGIYGMKETNGRYKMKDGMKKNEKKLRKRHRNRL